SVATLQPIHMAQLLTYRRLSKKPVGLLINFNAETIKQGLKRVVATHGRRYTPPRHPLIPAHKERPPSPSPSSFFLLPFFSSSLLSVSSVPSATSAFLCALCALCVKFLLLLLLPETKAAGPSGPAAR